MNENEINVLLDHFVGGLDSAESASVTEKINTLPLWSKTYKQVTHVFGSLNALKEQDSQEPVPEGLAKRTFQSILEQQNIQRESSQFLPKKSSETEQSVSTGRSKRYYSVKPSFFALSACTGFLLVFVLASVTYNYRHSTTNTNSIAADNAAVHNSYNNSFDFAVTGSSQPSSPLFTCSNSSEPSMAIPFSNNNFAVNSSEQLVDLSPSAGYSASEPYEHTVKMACPDDFVVLASQPEGRPIILVPQPHFPGELKRIQDVVNTPNVNIVTPVNYQ